MLADILGIILELGMDQLIGNVRMFVQHRVGDTLISGQGREITHLVKVASTTERHLRLDGKIFREYVCNELGAVRNYHICGIDLERRLKC